MKMSVVDIDDFKEIGKEVLKILFGCPAIVFVLKLIYLILHG